jgi:excisionase family DNA binding protein
LKTTPKVGKVTGINLVDETSELVAISQFGKIIRIDIKFIRFHKRTFHCMTVIERLEASVGLLTVKQVAELLDCHLMTLYVSVKEGRIPHLRVGSRVKFDGVALADWLREREVG